MRLPLCYIKFHLYRIILHCGLIAGGGEFVNEQIAKQVQTKNRFIFCVMYFVECDDV
jgi:hypothetical protein